MTPTEPWQHPAINNWRLLAIVAAALSGANVLAMVSGDVGSAEGISALIAHSVRLSVPWLYLAFAASSLQTLYPSAASRWLLRNRKMFGLAFAAGMAWQALFILWLVIKYTDYYVAEVYVLRDAIEGVIGYLLLLAMTITSFRAGRRRLSARQWKYLHTAGIYFLWAYAASVYWYEIYYYQTPDWLDYLLYYAGALAWALRLAAWIRQRSRKQTAPGPGATKRPVPGGLLLIAAGAALAVVGGYWTAPAYDALFGMALTEPLDLYFPYWPFVPFFPMALAMLGGLLLARYRRS